VAPAPSAPAVRGVERGREGPGGAGRGREGVQKEDKAIREGASGGRGSGGLVTARVRGGRRLSPRNLLRHNSPRAFPPCVNQLSLADCTMTRLAELTNIVSQCIIVGAHANRHRCLFLEMPRPTAIPKRENQAIRQCALENIDLISRRP
jgi:hypothetical protein